MDNSANRENKTFLHPIENYESRETSISMRTAPCDVVSIPRRKAFLTIRLQRTRRNIQPRDQIIFLARSVDTSLFPAFSREQRPSAPERRRDGRQAKAACRDAVTRLRRGKIQLLDQTEIGDAPRSPFPRFRKRDRIMLRCGNRSRKALGIKDALADKCHCSLWAEQQTRRAKEAHLRPISLT